MRRRTCIAGMVVFAAASRSEAATQDGKARVRVPANVDGDLANVEATVDGKPAKVLRLSGPSDDLLILVVLDLTGDIAAIEAARQGVAAQMRDLPENVWISVLKAQDQLGVLVDPGPDREAALRAINEYSAIGKAGLLDTVDGAAVLGDRLLDKTPVRVSVIYLTDSNVYNYREDFANPVINSSDSHDLSRRFPDQLVREKISKLTDRLLRTETPISIVHLQYRSDAINEAYQRGLEQMAQATGGTALICRSLAEVAESVERVFTFCRNQWSVFVELPEGKGRNVMVTLRAPERAISYRERFSFRR